MFLVWLIGCDWSACSWVGVIVCACGHSGVSVMAVSIMSACCRASVLCLYLLGCFLQVLIQGEGKTSDLWTVCFPTVGSVKSSLIIRLLNISYFKHVFTDKSGRKQLKKPILEVKLPNVPDVTWNVWWSICAENLSNTLH